MSYVDRAADDIDIIQKLMDFERCGTSAWGRVNLRENAAIEIFKLRAEVHSMKTALEKLRSYNVDIAAGRINLRPQDHIEVIDRALGRPHSAGHATTEGGA